MAREIVVWCDVHMEQSSGAQRVPGDEFTITINGAKPRTIALCADHQENILNALVEALQEHGMTGPPAQALPKRVRAASRPSGPAPDACLLCGEPVKQSKGAMGGHLRRAHDMTIRMVYGSICPLCGPDEGEFVNLGTHVGRFHPEVTLGVADAFVVAALNGDPHGVVAERRRVVAG